MTVYAKIENNKLICASNGYNGITGLADSSELCLANGFMAYTEEEVSGYFAGTHQIIDGVLINITNTPEYIAEQKAIVKQSIVKEYADIFKEFDRICGAKFSRGLCTTNQITAQRDILDDELTQKLEEIENG